MNNHSIYFADEFRVYVEFIGDHENTIWTLALYRRRAEYVIRGDGRQATRTGQPCDGAATRTEQSCDGAATRTEQPCEGAATRTEQPCDGAATRSEQPCQGAATRTEQKCKGTATRSEHPWHFGSTGSVQRRLGLLRVADCSLQGVKSSVKPEWHSYRSKEW